MMANTPGKMWGWEQRFDDKNPEQMAWQVVGSLCLNADERIIQEMRAEVCNAIKFAIVNAAKIPTEPANGNAALVFLKD